MKLEDFRILNKFIKKENLNKSNDCVKYLNLAIYKYYQDSLYTDLESYLNSNECIKFIEEFRATDLNYFRKVITMRF